MHPLYAWVMLAAFVLLGDKIIWRGRNTPGERFLHPACREVEDPQHLRRARIEGIAAKMR